MERLITEKSQHFWESTISFLEKMNEKTIKAENKLSIANSRQSMLDDVLKNVDKL